ncbi:MAG: glycosyltransferase, partial [Dehalococcoidia bacterium]|nr:glycosyltransferase [Dehalococcoidia bacterium]
TEGLAKRGHQVTVVAPEGSLLSPEIEVIQGPLRESEEQTWQRYRGRLETGEWEAVLDSSWERWANISNLGRDPQLPIVNWHHSAESVYSSSPDVQYPLWVGISRSHAEALGRHFQMPVRLVYNGIDLDVYKPAANKTRGGRYLWLARWTTEKGPAEVISLAKKLRVGLDMFGDQEVIGDRAYLDRCMREVDGLRVRASGGISRLQTVEEYSTHKGMLQWFNWKEPFGLTVIEAMACGCPPICARSGGVAETIRDGVTGFLVDDMEQMAELVKRDAVKEISVEAMRRHVEENFGLGTFVDRWEKLLQAVVSGERW